MKPGEIYLFSPFQYEYNPERNKSPKIGLFLCRVKGSSGLIKSYSELTRWRILGPQGIEELWCNQWAIDPISELP